MAMSASSHPSTSAPVLIVDDDEAIRETLRAVLEDEGYRVDESPDGEAAIAFLRATRERFVVLLDLAMPRMNGMEALRVIAGDPQLADRHAYALMSAMPQGTTLDAVAKFPNLPVAVVGKPFEINDLIDAVAREANRLSA